MNNITACIYRIYSVLNIIIVFIVHALASILSVECKDLLMVL